jgi:outer membrane protein assembly factor BamB
MKKLSGASIAALSIVLSLLVSPIFETIQTFGVNADSGTARKVEFTQLWNFTSSKSYAYSPVVADDFLYVTSTTSGGSEVKLCCLSLPSGTQVWNHTGLFDVFTVADGNVYVGSAVLVPNSLALQGVVSCLNAYNGAQLWKYSHGTSFGKPVVNEGIVYVGGFNYTWSTDINIGFIYAFNAQTGTRIWNFIGPVGTRFEYDSLILAGKNLYALSGVYSQKDASWHSGIYAFDAYTGNELWNYTTPGVFSGFTVAGQTVYVSSNFVNTTDYLDAEYSGGYIYEGGILALNASNGITMWNYTIHGSVESPIVVNDMAYAVSDNGKVYALDASDGTEIWKYATEKSLGHAQFADGALYVGSSDGAYCFDATKGNVLWNFAADDYADSSATYPTYADGVIYLGWNGPQFFSRVTQHNFYALNARGGEKIGNCTLAYTINSSPKVVDNVIYIGASSVTEESPDFIVPSAVIALNSTITLSHSPLNATITISPSPSNSTITITPPPSTALPASIALTAVLATAVVVVAATAFLIYRKRTKQPTNSGEPQRLSKIAQEKPAVDKL